MDTDTDPIGLLARALEQTADVLAEVREDQLGDPTPCGDWDVATLLGHVVASPDQFRTMVEGGEPDWAAAPSPVTGAAAAAADFRAAAAALLAALREPGRDAAQAGMPTTEIGVHTWDVARATGYPLDRLDPEVAEHALVFLRQGLTDDNRAGAFDPERPAPDGAGPYDRLAAFAGRSA